MIEAKKVSPRAVDRIKTVEINCQNEHKNYDWDIHKDQIEKLIEGKQDRDSLICPLWYRPFIDPVVTDHM